MTIATASAEGPATESAYVPGLAVSIYKLASAPRDITKIAAGHSPDAAWTLPALAAQQKDFHDLTTNFQAEIDGEFLAAAGGDYQFDVVSDDGLDLKLDGVVAVSDRGEARHSYATVVLDQGWHPIHVSYFQSDGAMGFRVRVRPPGAADFVDVTSGSLRVRQEAIDRAAESVGKPDDEAAAKPWRSVFKSYGFAGLTRAEANITTELFEGPTGVSKAARVEWRKLSESTRYERLTGAQQTMVLSGFLHGWLYYSPSRPQPTTRAAYTLSAPQPLDHFAGWEGADRHGVKYVMTIDGRAIDIFMPSTELDESEGVPKAVAGLPYYLRQQVDAVHVEPYGTAAELDGLQRTIWVRLPGPSPLQPLDDHFVHEAGHLLMQRTDSAAAWSEAVGKDVLSVSQYARRNAHEDFAEFIRLYVAAYGDADQLRSLRVLYPNRMIVMEAVAKQVGGPDGPTTLPAH